MKDAEAKSKNVPKKDNPTVQKQTKPAPKSVKQAASMKDDEAKPKNVPKKNNPTVQKQTKRPENDGSDSAEESDDQEPMQSGNTIYNELLITSKTSMSAIVEASVKHLAGSRGDSSLIELKKFVNDNFSEKIDVNRHIAIIKKQLKAVSNSIA